QGVYQGLITTLGRGGSDLTAVALSAGLGLECCEIYTDVPGVMTTDPKIDSNARVIDRISYDEMIDFADAGAKVLQARCVVLAKRYQLNITVRSSFEKSLGTIVGKETQMENMIVSGIALDRAQVYTSMQYSPQIHAQIMQGLPGVCARILQMKNSSETASIVFLTNLCDFLKLQNWQSEMQSDAIFEQHRVAAVTIIGVGLMLQKEIFLAAHNVLNQNGIDMIGSWFADGRICLLVPESKGEETVRALHAFYGLEKEPN
ncbi:MAG: hypothetical protein R3A45_13395, partial [Bdellovibrionota bacterium]